jgi:hypothetical protein
VRHDDQPVDLLVAGIGQREHRPIRRALAGRLLHAADDAVGAGRGRDRDGVGVGVDHLGDAGQVDRCHVGAHVDGLDGLGGRHAEKGSDDQKCSERCRAPEAQATPSASDDDVTAPTQAKSQSMGAVKPPTLCRFHGLNPWSGRPIPNPHD